MVTGTFGSKKKAEEQLNAFVAAVEEVMARVPLSQPEPVQVRAIEWDGCETARGHVSALGGWGCMGSCWVDSGWTG